MTFMYLEYVIHDRDWSMRIMWPVSQQYNDMI